MIIRAGFFLRSAWPSNKTARTGLFIAVQILFSAEGHRFCFPDGAFVKRGARCLPAKTGIFGLYNLPAKVKLRELNVIFCRKIRVLIISCRPAAACGSLF